MAQLKSTSVVGNITATGNLLASKIIKLGGTASQILMADGSVMNAEDVGAGTVTSVGVSSSSLTVTGSPITGAGTITVEHPTKTATTADIYKVGMDGLGHVVLGNKITPSDLGLSTVYRYMGTKTWAELKALTSAEIGDVYSITDKDPDGNTNADWACYTKVTAATGDNYATYWQSLGGKVDLSAYVQGPSTSTANAIARYDGTTGKIIKDSKVTIDDSGNVIPITSVASDLGASSNIWKNAHIKAIHLRVGGQDTGTPNANAYGLGFWKPSFYTWYEYMAPNTGNSPTGAKAPQYGDVTTYARRSLIENTSGYGWIWEACGNTSNAIPVGKMALSSSTGNLKVAGSVTANGFKHSDTTKGSNSYVLLAGGDAKPLSDFVTSDGTKVTSDKVYMSKNFTYTTAIGVLPEPSGSGTISCQGKTLDQFLDSILSERIAPTVTNPSYTLTVTATKNYGNEVGSIISKLSYETSSSAGSYNYGSKEYPNSTETGITLSYNVKYNGTSIGTTAKGSKDSLSIVIDSTSSKTYATLNGTMTCGGTVRTPLDNLGDDKDANGTAYTKASTATKTYDANVTLTGYYEGCYYGTITSAGGITSDSQLTSSVIRGLSKTGAKYSSKTLTLNVGVGTTAIIIACDADKKGPTNVVNTTVNAPMTTLFGSGNVFAEVDVNSGNNASYKKKYKVWIYTPASGAYTQSASLTITLGS